VISPRNQPSSVSEMGDDGGLDNGSCAGAVDITSGNDKAISFSDSKYSRSLNLCDISNAFDFNVGDTKGDVRGRCSDRNCVKELELSMLNSVSNCGDNSPIE